MSFATEVIISVLLIIGGVFVLIGSIGLSRLQDLYTRLHAPTKATTVGLGSILVASMIYMAYVRDFLSINELLITLFLVITAPVTAHILAKAAMHNGVKPMERTKNADLIKKARQQLPPDSQMEE
ncbi:Na+/H+ antiporter subunit G [Alteromonas sp. ASW11-36]|uniref:Na+/H+ antiporter subunit G n=1 Tax=Alteromonas arenosi TaxID=3055817 RepID=A0ABT7SSD1_9ALTE|nr:Na+/H+ antiporter subunit G [Alteromonas sp. ASW11-36]MDM7859104.1 Na+/H+ antiporter subunit G [Alteromonas sp. ASW11-36]